MVTLKKYFYGYSLYRNNINQKNFAILWIYGWLGFYFGFCITNRNFYINVFNITWLTVSTGRISFNVHTVKGDKYKFMMTPAFYAL